MEATSQLRQASSSSQAFDAVKARVVTRSFGVRIGSFGVDYTSRKVELDPEEQSARKNRDTSGQAFQTEMERERLRQEVSDVAWNERSQDSGAQDGARPGTQAEAQTAAAPAHEDPLWRRGLAAYAKARDLLLADAVRTKGTRLAVA